MQSQTNIQPIEHQTTFPLPFTVAQLRQDILNIYLLQLRITYLVADPESVWTLTQKPPRIGGALWNPDVQASDFGLSYSDIRHTELAKALEQEYDYGFFGILGIGLEQMHYESIHTWVAAYLMDLKSSETVSEWESYGVDLAGSVSRCLHTCELANARVVLEGNEAFSHFAGIRGDGKDSSATALDALTVRQMALLSGMEEMTIRTAVSRKSANPLQTYKDDRRTLVSTEIAKAWLIAKGRYVPITRRWSGGELNLEKTKFTSIDAIDAAIDDRIRQLELRGVGRGDLRKEMDAAFLARGFRRDFVLEQASLRDSGLMTRVAEILELPTNLLVLRAREAALHDELATLERAVRETADDSRSS